MAECVKVEHICYNMVTHALYDIYALTLGPHASDKELMLGA